MKHAHKAVRTIELPLSLVGERIYYLFCKCGSVGSAIKGISHKYKSYGKPSWELNQEAK